MGTLIISFAWYPASGFRAATPLVAGAPAHLNAAAQAIASAPVLIPAALPADSFSSAAGPLPLRI